MGLNKSILCTIFLWSFLLACCVEAKASPGIENFIGIFLNPPKSESKASPILAYSPSLSPSPSPFVAHQTSFNLPKPTTKIDPKLKEICDGTEHPDNCISLLAPYLKGSVREASTLRFIIRMLRRIIRDAHKIAREVTADASTSWEIKSSLDASLDLYNKALDHLKQASVEFKARNFNGVGEMLSAIISNLGYCNEAFEKKGLTTWPLKETNDLLIEFAGYGVDIATKLKTSVKSKVWLP